MESFSFPPPPSPLPPRTLVHASAVVCWVFLSVVCVSFVGLSVWRTFAPAVQEATTQPTTRPTTQMVAGQPPAVAEADEIDTQTELAGESTVGIKRLSPDQVGPAFEAMANFAAASRASRVATAIVAGEVKGRDAALQRLRTIPGPDAAAFAAVYENPSPATRPDLSDLKERYGWFADLAAAFGQPDADPQRAATLAKADRTLRVLGLGMTVLGVAFAGGLGCFVTAIVLLANGKVTARVGPPAGPSHIYVEAFTVYLGSFILLSVVLELLGRTSLPPLPLWGHLVLQAGTVVAAVAWPFLRGVDWPTLRQDWGVHTGRGVVVEMLSGVGGYLAGLPIVGVGFVVTSLLLKWSHSTASHPITGAVEGHPLLVVLLACVFAPVTEELMFRGALVSHLRGTWGVVMAAVINGVVFASIHPQGWAVVPVLASIGAVFGVMRQWRGSLLPSMTAHAINNGFVMLLLIATR